MVFRAGGTTALHLPALDERNGASVSSAVFTEAPPKFVGPHPRIPSLGWCSEGPFVPGLVESFAQANIVSLIVPRAFAAEAGAWDNTFDLESAGRESEFLENATQVIETYAMRQELDAGIHCPFQGPIAAIAVDIAKAMICVAAFASAAWAKDQKQEVHMSQKTYLIRPERHKSRGVECKIKVVDRERVAKGPFIDIAGLRLFVPDVKSQRTLRGYLSNKWAAFRFVTDTLSKAQAETGLDPDLIPITGEGGKKLGTEGMVRLEAGEYVRPGEYFVSNYVQVPYAVKGERYRVRLSSFYIDRFMVTNAQYCEFLNDGNTGYWTPWNPRITRNRERKFTPADAILRDLPVVSVTWYQAVGYAQWAGKRLPTEAEWEYAAGGKEGRKYPWGDQEPDATRANAKFLGSKHVTPGDAFPAGRTPEGVFDLAGNAGEWVWDYYDKDYYGKAPAGGVLVDPRGPAAGSPAHEHRRMFKSYCIAARDPGMLRVLKRHSRPPLLPSLIGFRCVKSDTTRGDG